MTVAKHAEHAECQNMLLDPRITNTQVGIPGETVPEGGNLRIYYVQK